MAGDGNDPLIALLIAHWPDPKTRFAYCAPSEPRR